MDRKANAERVAVVKPKRPERPKRLRNRPEAILVKVGQDKEWTAITAAWYDDRCSSSFW